MEFVATKVVKEEVIRARVDKDLKDRLKEMCKDKKMNMSELIIYMIENEVNKYEFKIRNKQKIESRISNTEKKIINLKSKFK
jgi:antitoxin component of RelBE/YafQ-DinJ toxin-antitoxin module